MKIMDVLAGTAKTGRLGPVSVGADWAEVTAALGEPREIVVSRRRRWPRLFGYGDLEVSVCRCRKVGIIVVQTWSETVGLPPEITGGTGVFPSGLAHADVVAALDAAGCDWEPYGPGTFGDQRTLVVIPSAAHFTFHIPEGGEPVLDSVGLSGDGHDCSAQATGAAG